jgi:hypothetical protein
MADAPEASGARSAGAIDPGCVETPWAGDAQNCFLRCLLLTKVASGIDFQNDEIETENSMRKFNAGVFTPPGPKADLMRRRSPSNK